MALWGAFTNSCTAMMAQSHCMNVISQNIVNINSIGYKRVEDNFADALSETHPGGLKIFGVKPQTRQLIDQQGPILGTGKARDLAINGEGFFIVNPTTSTTTSSSSGEVPYTFTRDGNFDWAIDVASTATASSGSTSATAANRTAANYDVSISDLTGNRLYTYRIPDTTNATPSYLATRDGQYLMGYAASSTGTFTTSSALTGLSAIRTTPYQLSGGQATANVTLRANLNASATSAQSFSIPVYKAISNSVSNVTNYLGDTIQLTFTPSTTTANSWTVSVAGNNVATSSVAASSGGTTITFDGNGNVTSPTDGIFTVDLTWNDVNVDTTTTSTTETSSTTGTTTTTSVTSSTGTTITTSTSSNGTLTTTSTTGTGTNPTVQTTPTASSISFNLKDLVQLGGNQMIYSLVQDGIDNGYLRDTYFTDEGYLVGSFTNATTKRLYQIPYAYFSAPNQLEMLSNTRFALSEGAGDVTVDTVGAASGSGKATFTAGGLEMSNVDIGDEFTKMIITQKAYSLASKVFQTADEMSQTARDLTG